jgi:peptide deformylase
MVTRNVTDTPSPVTPLECMNQTSTRTPETPPANNSVPLTPQTARVLQITRYPNTILQTPTSPVTVITTDLRALGFDMLATLRASGLVGIAAPQVGVNADLMVVDVARSNRASRLFLGGRDVPVESVMPLILFNTEISPHEKIRDLGFEGCGSVPGVRVQIERPAATRVTAMNHKGEILQFVCAGLLARVIQHEWDHLRGVLFMDRMSPETLSSVQPELDQLRKSQSVTAAPLSVTPLG